MRRFIFSVAFWFALPLTAFAQSSVVTSGNATPATCKANTSYKPMYYKNGTGLYVCTADNVWTLVAGIGVVTTTGSPSSGDIAKFSGSGTITTSFVAFSGPSTSTKTFTLPNANATVLTDNALVTVAQGGHGSAPASDDQVFVSSSTSAGAWKTVADCAGTNQGLTYSQSSNSWGCQTISGVGGGGAPDNAQYWTGAADGTLSAEKNLGALSTGLVINTSGVPSAYGGSSCSAGSIVASVSASGVLTCTTLGVPVTIVKSADESVTSSTAFQDDDHLVFALVANATYQIDGVLLVTGSTGGDIRVTFSIPTSATAIIGETGMLVTATTSDQYSRALSVTDFATPDYGNFGAVSTSTAYPLFVKGSVFTAGSSGNLTLRWCQDTSSGTATTVKKGSFITVTRIS